MASSVVELILKAKSELGPVLEQGVKGFQSMIDVGKKLGTTLTDFAQKHTVGAIKSMANMQVTFGDLFQAGGALGRMFGGLASAMGESLKRAAEGGDESAKKFIESFKGLQKAVDGITAAFVKDMIPVLQPVIGYLTELAQRVATWADETDAGTVVARFLVDALLYMVTAMESLVSVTLSAFESILHVGKKVAFLFSEDLYNSISDMEDSVRGFRESWDETASSIETGLASIASGAAATAEEVDHSFAEMTAAAEEFINTQSEEGKQAAKAALDQQRKDSDERKQVLQEDMRFELEATRENLQLKLDTLNEFLPQIATLYGDHNIEVLKLQHEITLTQQELDAQRIASAKAVAEAAAEAAAKIIQSGYAAVAGMVGANVKLLASEKTTTTSIVADITARYQKIQGIVGGGITALITGEKSLSQTLKTLALETTKALLADLLKRTTEAMALRAAETAGKITADEAARLSSIKGIPGNVAGWASKIPFPLGGILAAAAIALLTGLASKVLKFAEGGSPLDRLQGAVGGFGFQDSVPALVQPREFVVREAAAAPSRNKAFLDDFSQTGDVAGAAVRGGFVSPGNTGGRQRIEIMISMREPQRALTRALMESMNFEVLHGDVELVSSSFKG